MLPLTLPILRLLSDGAFHSGEDIAARLSVSRASVWNALQGCEAWGIELFKVRGRGYRLAQPMEWLDVVRIKEQLGPGACDLTLEVLDITGSTNTCLMQRAQLGARHQTCVAAELQTQGRGRRGRSWHAGLGGALTFSLLWRFDAGVAQLSGLSLAVGVAIARGLDSLGFSNIKLKWPNDLIHGYRKLGGVLVELQGDALGPSAVVIGVGLNVRLDTHTRDRIDQAVVDLDSLSDERVSRNRLLAVLLQHLTRAMEAFEHTGFEGTREDWQARHAYHDKRVRLRFPDGAEVAGQVRGVGSDGALILETAEGERCFGSGEISLRPADAMA